MSVLLLLELQRHGSEEPCVAWIGSQGGWRVRRELGEGVVPSNLRYLFCDGIPAYLTLDWVEVLATRRRFTKRTVWNGAHYGVLWLASESTGGGRPLHFVRVSPEVIPHYSTIRSGWHRSGLQSHRTHCLHGRAVLGFAGSNGSY